MGGTYEAWSVVDACYLPGGLAPVSYSFTNPFPKVYYPEESAPSVDTLMRSMDPDPCHDFYVHAQKVRTCPGPPGRAKPVERTPKAKTLPAGKGESYPYAAEIEDGTGITSGGWDKMGAAERASVYDQLRLTPVVPKGAGKAKAKAVALEPADQKRTRTKRGKRTRKKTQPAEDGDIPGDEAEAEAEEEEALAPTPKLAVPAKRSKLDLSSVPAGKPKLTVVVTSGGVEGSSRARSLTITSGAASVSIEPQKDEEEAIAEEGTDPNPFALIAEKAREQTASSSAEDAKFDTLVGAFSTSIPAGLVAMLRTLWSQGVKMQEGLKRTVEDVRVANVNIDALATFTKDSIANAEKKALQAAALSSRRVREVAREEARKILSERALKRGKKKTSSSSSSSTSGPKIDDGGSTPPHGEPGDPPTDFDVGRVSEDERVTAEADAFGRLRLPSPTRPSSEEEEDEDDDIPRKKKSAES